MQIKLSQAYSFCQQGQRDNQEDARFPNVDQASVKQRFFVVCDGVGGCDKGELASRIVSSTFGEALSAFDFNRDFSNADFRMALDQAFDALDDAAQKGNGDMATTLTFAAFHAAGATLAHIGDSRIYQIRPRQGIVYRSDDHSLVNQMVHSGIITPEEAEHHPQRNVITRCMEPVSEDQARSMATVFQTTDIQKNDYFLLCTDGVLHCLTDDQLVDLLATDQTDEQKIHLMAQMCEDSSDNNTAYLIRIEDVTGVEEDEDMQQQTSTTRKNNHAHQILSEIESVKTTTKRKGCFDWLRKIFGFNQ